MSRARRWSWSHSIESRTRTSSGATSAMSRACTTRVDDDREHAAVGPAPERRGGPLGDHPVSLGGALRAPRHAAAVTADVGRDPHRQPGTLGDGRERRRNRRLLLPAARAEDPVDAGGHVDRGRALAHGERQLGRRGRRHPRAQRHVGAGPGETLGEAGVPGDGGAEPLGLRVCARSRNSLISVPVSIPTGQAWRQEPSTAHVSMPSYSNCSSSARRTGEPAGWRAVSRAARSAGAASSVTLRDRHTGSQKPRSMRFVAASSISGSSLRWRRSPGVAVEHDPARGSPLGRRAA